MITHDLIFLSLEDWDHIWRRNQFVCSTLARRHPEMKILFVGIPRHAKNLLASGNLKPLLTNPTHAVPEFSNITVTTPLRPAPDKTKWGLRLNETFYRRHIAAAAQRLGLKNPILWINPHNAYHVIDDIPHSALIYDITDDWTSFTQNDLDRERTIAADRVLCHRADATIVCSEKLWELKTHLVPEGKLHFVKNGVDADHYAAVLQTGPIPENLATLPRPLFGYTGTLHPDRLDIDLLLKTAALLKTGSIALIGPNHLPPSDQSALQHTGKIHILPAIPYHEIPNAMRAFDVAITPHKVTPFTESLNPIKLFEYFAAGKPIVSTPVAGFRDHPSLVRLAGTPEEFAAALQSAVTEPNSPAAMQSEAKKHSWQSRVDQIEEVFTHAGAPLAPPPRPASSATPVGKPKRLPPLRKPGLASTRASHS